MLYIDGNSIRLTRGDTAYLTFPLEVDTGEEYIMGANDTLELSLKEHILGAAPILRKEIVGSNTFHIEPADTAGLSFGKYRYDVQLTTSSGDVFTVIDVDTFEIMCEVTC